MSPDTEFSYTKRAPLKMELLILFYTAFGLLFTGCCGNAVKHAGMAEEPPFAETSDGEKQLSGVTVALPSSAANLTENVSTDAALLREKWGVEIIGIVLSSAGYMLDFRYRVLDPDKAAPLFERKFKPYLTDEASGMQTVVPNAAKVGPLRQTTRKPVVNGIYYMLFANPGQYIKKGAKVTVVIGEFRAEHIVVD